MSTETMLTNYAEWPEISAAEGGTIFHDGFDEGLRFIIMKGGSSLCAYVGIPIDHPLSGFDYDDLPVNAHGGLTFSNKGGSKNSDNKVLWPKGYWWYGWDYAHSGDYCDYYDKPPFIPSINRQNDKKWTVKEVEQDSWGTIYDFKKLMSLSEKIFKKIKWTSPE